MVALEAERLRTTRRHAGGNWSLTKPHRAPLNDLDVASIVARRIERWPLPLALTVSLTLTLALTLT